MARPTYGKTDLFQMVTLDAGFSSAENAAVIHDAGYGYLMRLKDDRRDLTASAIRRLGHLKANTARHETVDKVGSSVVIRRIWIERISTVDGWPHVRGIIRVQTTTESSDGEVTLFDRYYATNYCAAGLNAGHWLALVRGHWAVENNCHWVYDTAFSEDKLPWIQHPQGLLNVALLRRLAFNMLALYRTVTLKGGTLTTWPKTLRMFRDSILRAKATLLAGLRKRRPAGHTA
jgi:predicted transposase YbfD/YdcC